MRVRGLSQHCEIAHLVNFSRYKCALAQGIGGSTGKQEQSAAEVTCWLVLAPTAACGLVSDALR